MAKFLFLVFCLTGFVTSILWAESGTALFPPTKNPAPTPQQTYAELPDAGGAMGNPHALALQAEAPAKLPIRNDTATGGKDGAAKGDAAKDGAAKGDAAPGEHCTASDGRSLLAALVGRAREFMAPRNCAAKDGTAKDGTAKGGAETEPVPEQETAPAAGRPAEPGRPIRIYENKEVREYLRLFQDEYRNVFERGLRRSGKYLPMIHAIFAEAGLPPELAYLAAVESNFNPRARSSARAMGLWQFMAPTARRFGLRVRYPWYDERLDPDLSTQAAARLLIYLHKVYHSWELALAAYNAGEGRVNRALRRARRRGTSTSFWHLQLPPQTRAYVPAFMALTRLYQDPDRYGFSHVDIEPPLLTETLEVDFSTSLVEVATRLEVPVREMVRLNFAWRRGYIPSTFEGKAVLRLPVGMKRPLLDSMASEPVKSIPWLTHKVEEGETLSRIAEGYGLAMKEIISVNPLTNRHFLAIGQELLIPLTPGQVPARRLETRRTDPASDGRRHPPETSLHLHKVRAGESLWSIARAYGVRVGQLKSWNSGLKQSLQPEQELIVFRAWRAARSSDAVEDSS